MALSENLVLGFVNRLDSAAAITVGSHVPAFPATNLRLQDLSRPYRTAGVVAPDSAGRDVTAGRTWVEIDLGQGLLVQMLAIVQHNLSQAARYRLRLSNAADFSVLDYDSGLVAAWPTVGAFGSLPWGTFQWGGFLPPAEAAYYTISSFRLLQDGVVSRYCRLDLEDPGNLAGYLHIGRLFLGPVWQPSINMELDWSIGWEDPTEEVRALGGGLSFDQRPRYRVLSFTLGHVPEGEALANVTDYLDRRKGRSGDVVVIPQPAKPETWAQEAMYGRQRRLDPLRSPYLDFRRTRGFEIEELR